VIIIGRTLNFLDGRFQVFTFSLLLLGLSLLLLKRSLLLLKRSLLSLEL